MARKQQRFFHSPSASFCVVCEQFRILWRWQGCAAWGLKPRKQGDCRKEALVRLFGHEIFMLMHVGSHGASP
jgi:hypothetical protein